MRFGFIGLGNLGRQLAANLLRGGFEVTVHDLDPEAAADLIGAGAIWASSPKAAAETADSVITCLPSPAAVAAVVAGENGEDDHPAVARRAGQGRDQVAPLADYLSKAPWIFRATTGRARPRL
jgi:3-hydroxyisobutyrate dehydrogenase-like beta-hydroxyacid dehydrogenase